MRLAATRSVRRSARSPRSRSVRHFRHTGSRFRLFVSSRSHRYATNLSLLEVLQPQGWTIEGVVLCAAN
jgi:hypothetical protein